MTGLNIVSMIQPPDYGLDKHEHENSINLKQFGFSNLASLSLIYN